MNLPEALLQEVLAHPEDDTPRLIGADWLSERGDPRGEFIRLQCRSVTLDPADPQQVVAACRQEQLLARRRLAWLGPLRRWVEQAEFRRGFVESVTLDATRFLEHAGKLFARTPLRRVNFRRLDRPLAALAASPHLRRLEGLGFGDYRGPAEAVAELFNADEFPRLKHLQVSHPAMADKLLAVADRAPALAGLQTLDLRQAGFACPPLVDAFQQDAWASLRSLKLGPLAAEEARPGDLAWHLARMLNRLEHLELQMCGLGGGELRQLFRLSTIPTLRELRLPRNPLHWQGVQALRNAAGLHRLAGLDLSSCQLNARAFGLLAEMPALARLVRLDLRDNLIDPRGAKLLAESPYLGSVRTLRLRGVRLFQVPFELRDEGLRLILDGCFQQLIELDVSRNGLSPAAAQTIGDWPGRTRLSRLNLSRNALGDRGGRAMAELGDWPALCWLDLRDNGLGPGAKRLLRQVFGDRVGL